MPTKKNIQAASRRAFAERLRPLVNRAGSLEKFGETIGVSHTAVSGWLSGSNWPSGQVLETIARVHGESLDRLVLGVDDASDDASLERAVGKYVTKALNVKGSAAKALFSLVDEETLGAGLLAALVELATTEAAALRKAAVGWGASAKVSSALLSMRHVVDASNSAQIKARFEELQHALSAVRMRHSSIADSLLVKHIPQVRMSMVLVGLDAETPSEASRRLASPRKKKRRK